MKDLQVPSGIQPGDAVKLRHMGVPNFNKPSVRGDHIFTVNVLIPKDIRYEVFYHINHLFKTEELNVMVMTVTQNAYLLRN